MANHSASGATTELFEHAMEMWETAIQTGVKIQEESTKRFTDMMAHVGPTHDWPKRTQAFLTDAVQTTQKNVEEAMRVMNDSAKRTMDMLHKAMEVGQVESNADPQAKARDVWEATLSALRANAQAIVQANTRVLESWAELGKKLNGTMNNGNP